MSCDDVSCHQFHELTSTAACTVYMHMVHMYRIYMHNRDYLLLVINFAEEAVTCTAELLTLKVFHSFQNMSTVQWSCCTVYSMLSFLFTSVILSDESDLSLSAPVEWQVDTEEISSTGQMETQMTA